jgi:hypothetical protein
VSCCDRSRRVAYCLRTASELARSAVRRRRSHVFDTHQPPSPQVATYSRHVPSGRCSICDRRLWVVQNRRCWLEAICASHRGTTHLTQGSFYRSPTRHILAIERPPRRGSLLVGLPRAAREAELENFARCPVCVQEFPISGPDGVMVHLLAVHADTPEARWIMQQLWVPVMQRSG